MADVSRETPPPPDPAVLSQVFAPSRLPVLEEYAALLASEGVLRGLIGPREVPRLWDRHLINCGLVAPLVPEGSRVADLGSGAGLPGLVLALARPALEVTLVEPMARRVAFLTEACATLGAVGLSLPAFGQGQNPDDLQPGVNTSALPPQPHPPTRSRTSTSALSATAISYIRWIGKRRP